jgi:hypothetical protein
MIKRKTRHLPGLSLYDIFYRALMQFVFAGVYPPNHLSAAFLNVILLTLLADSHHKL